MTLKEFKAKKWVKKIIKKNNATTTPVQSLNYIHSSDKIALEALKKIPLFDKLCNKMITIFNEPFFVIENMASYIRITEQQLPHIYFMVQSISRKLGIAMPDLYLKNDRDMNAYTYGGENHFIVIHTGLLECMEDDEIYAVLAHECGHIACQHVLYKTVGRLVLQGGVYGLSKLDNVLHSTLIGSLITTAAVSSLELAYYHWSRCAELSADRIAVLCCESAEPIIDSMMRLAGGTTHIDSEINRDLFLQQAIEYKKHIDEKKSAKVVEFLSTSHASHPLLALRAYEAKQFSESPSFLAYLDPSKISSPQAVSGELPAPAEVTNNTPEE